METASAAAGGARSFPFCLWRNSFSALCRWMLCTCEVGDHMAFGPPALLHRAQLHPAALAPVVHGDLCALHPVDRRLLLPHGVDGKRQASGAGSEKLVAPLKSHCF